MLLAVISKKHRRSRHFGWHVLHTAEPTGDNREPTLTMAHQIYLFCVPQLADTKYLNAEHKADLARSFLRPSATERGSSRRR
jgi:hypothetical protein